MLSLNFFKLLMNLIQFIKSRSGSALVVFLFFVGLLFLVFYFCFDEILKNIHDNLLNYIIVLIFSCLNLLYILIRVIGTLFNIKDSNLFNHPLFDFFADDNENGDLSIGGAVEPLEESELALPVPVGQPKPDLNLFSDNVSKSNPDSGIENSNNTPAPDETLAALVNSSGESNATPESDAAPYQTHASEAFPHLTSISPTAPNVIVTNEIDSNCPSAPQSSEGGPELVSTPLVRSGTGSDSGSGNNSNDTQPAAPSATGEGEEYAPGLNSSERNTEKDLFKDIIEAGKAAKKAAPEFDGTPSEGSGCSSNDMQPAECPPSAPQEEEQELAPSSGNPPAQVVDSPYGALTDLVAAHNKGKARERALNEEYEKSDKNLPRDRELNPDAW